MVSRVTSLASLLYVATSCCSFSPSPIVPVSSSFLSTGSDADFYQKTQSYVEIFIFRVKPNKVRRDPRSGVFFGQSELPLDQNRDVLACYAKHNCQLCKPVSKRGQRSAINVLGPLMTLVTLPLLLKKPIIGSTSQRGLIFSHCDCGAVIALLLGYIPRLFSLLFV